MHQGDLSSSNFLNSERSSLNQRKTNNHLQATSAQQNTIQYTNGDQASYLHMFHHTEDHRRPPNALSEPSTTHFNGKVENQFSQDRLKMGHKDIQSF